MTNWLICYNKSTLQNPMNYKKHHPLSRTGKNLSMKCFRFWKDVVQKPSTPLV